MKSINRFLCDEDGVTAIEYSLIASLLALAIISGVTLSGEALNDMFDFVALEIQGVADRTGSG